METDFKSVGWVVQKGLCHQCGFCQSFCPEKAIQMVRRSKTGEILPKIDHDRCTHCGSCLKICPGHEMNFSKYYRSYLSAPMASQYYGYIKSAFIGHCTSQAKRYNASSGGVLSDLAGFALSSRILDYIIFARQKKDQPFESETVITNDPDVIMAQKGSLYFPVPLGQNFIQLIENQIRENDRLGLIGLPCHIHAVHKLSRYKSYNWQLLFGLFCGGTWTYKAAETFLKTIGIDKQQLRAFSFRGNGWPGKISWEYKDGKKGSYRRHGQVGIKAKMTASIFRAHSCFTPTRCMTCSDGLAELADLSFGDPWLRSQKKEVFGNTLVVARTQKALQLIEQAEKEGRITLKPVSPAEVVAAQKGMLMIKQNSGIFQGPLSVLSTNRMPQYTIPWTSAPLPARLKIYGFVSYFAHLVGRLVPSCYFRFFLTGTQSLIRRILKRNYIRLTDKDHENYFG